jgi:5-methyltetrahydrofolate--homocysteine methyltransferase
MDKSDLLNQIATALADLDSDGIKREIQSAIEHGVSVQELIRNGLGEGMRIVGERYEKGEYFLAELIMAGVTMNEALELIKPLLNEKRVERIGKAVIGTVMGDLHDIGKNIVISMLQSAGFDIIDLGVDVPPEKFVEAVKTYRPNLLCLSALLSVTMPNIEATVRALEREGLRKDVKILVGGRCLNSEIASRMGADAYGKDAWDAVVKAKLLIK